MGKLVRRVLEGYQTVAEWSPDDPSSLHAAQQAMAREVEAGYTAVLSDDGENEPVSELPPDADLVILTTAMGGG